MTPSHREKPLNLFTHNADLHRLLVEGVAEGRKLTVAEVEEALEQAPLSAQDALDRDLVDGLAYDDELRDWLEALLKQLQAVDSPRLGESSETI